MRPLLFVLLACVWLGGEEKTKKPQYGMHVIETAAHRREETIALDGRVRITGEKPVRGLVILFDFLAPAGGVVTTQRFVVDESVLEPGDEATFRAQLTDPVRAVRYRLNATDRLGRDFVVTNRGPFPIE